MLVCFRGVSFEILRVQNTRQVAFLDSLQREGGNQRRADTASVLSRQDLDGVFLLGVLPFRPVEDLAQSLGAAGLEVRVLVEDGAVGAHVAALVPLLLADGGDAAGRQAGGARADELGGPSDQLQLGTVGDDVELGVEEIESLGQVLKRVAGF